MPRRRRGRTGGDDQVALNLTPLLDVVLQLITFFMMLIHFGAKLEGEDASIRLPTTPAALPGGDLGLDRLVVSVDARGRLIAGGGAYDQSSSAPWWSAEAEARRAGRAAIGVGEWDDELPTLVVVRADKAASYGAIRRLLAEAQDRGFARFSLLVLREDER